MGGVAVAWGWPCVVEASIDSATSKTSFSGRRLHKRTGTVNILIGCPRTQFVYYLQTPHLPPSLAQCLQYLQFLHAWQGSAPVHVAEKKSETAYVLKMKLSKTI